MHASKVPLGINVAFAPVSIRIPDGPSVPQATGIPNSSRDSVTPPNAQPVPPVTLGLFIPSPIAIHAKSSSENCATKSSIEFSPFLTFISFMPLSPVQGISTGRLSAILLLMSSAYAGIFSFVTVYTPFSQSGFILSKLSRGDTALLHLCTAMSFSSSKEKECLSFKESLLTKILYSPCSRTKQDLNSVTPESSKEATESSEKHISSLSSSFGIKSSVFLYAANTLSGFPSIP